MSKGVLPGAVLVVAVTIAAAAPIAGWIKAGFAQTAGPQSTQTAPNQHETQGMPGGMGMQENMDMRQMMRGMMDGGQAMGPMSRMHQSMTRASPRERCEERLARRAAMVSYTITKLNLTAEQKPLWDKLNSVLQMATDRERQLCASLPSAGQRGQETILDRVNRREQFLSARLQALQQAKPALEALYQSLSPDQKGVINHPFR